MIAQENLMKQIHFFPFSYYHVETEFDIRKLDTVTS
jgi:hypothetical protein